MAYYMWRLRRRAAGRCTGPYAGAAVGAMYGPCRRRASGDAAVARVVVCTVARPLVRIDAGRVPWCPLGFVVADGECRVVIRWAAVQFVLRVRRPVWQMRSILVLSEASCNSCFIEKHIPLHRL